MGLDWLTMIMLFEEVAATSVDLSVPVLINSFGAYMLQQLAPAQQHRLQLLGGLIGQRPGRGLHAGPEEGEHLGIDPIGLGQAAQRPSEVTHLARIDDRHRQARRGERSRQGRFIPPGCLEHHEGDRLRLTLRDQNGQAAGIGRELAAEAGRLTGELHGGLGHIEAEVERSHSISRVAVTMAQPCRCGVISRQLCGLSGPGWGGPSLTSGLGP